MNKLKDVAGLLKAKITKDQLEEALINATSQQNWQASTHILHQIANAAYNYQKWQQINQFIWDKLKKGKSWRKILKTLGLVEFLLKNGPPSIISSFKYDIYQFRSFDNFSHYDDGIDRGQSIRERAKAVVDLLSNEEQLQEERLKAKTIRERMSGVVSGSNYGGFTGKQSSISSSKYGNIDNKSYKEGGFSAGSSYNEGGLGVYGDYGTTKSTLDKYKDKTVTPTATKKPTGSTITQPLNDDPKDKDKEMVLENKKPFETVAKKLVKPGSKPVPKQETQTNVNQKPQSNKNIIDDVDIFGSQTFPHVQHPSVQQPVVQQPIQQTFVQQTQPVQQTTNAFDLGFSFETPAAKPFQQPNQQPIQQQIQQQVQPVQQPQAPIQNLYQQPTNVPQNFNNLNMNPYNQPQFPQQQPLYGQQQQFGGFGQQQQPQQPQQQQNTQFGMMGGYQQQIQPGYGQQYQQPMMQGQMGMGFNQNQGFGQQYQQPQNQFQQQQSWNQSISLSAPTQQPKPQGGLGSISLKTTTTQKKDEDEFGNFASGQNANVKWLTSEEKGLIDFSDFGDQLKNGGNKNQQKNNSANSGNNIDTTWSW